MMTTTATVSLILGAALLLLGRKLFWLFVGVIGFLAGMYFGQQFLGTLPENTLLIISVICGLIGIVLAIFIQKIAIGAAGFFAGGFFAMNVGSTFAGSSETTGWVLFVIGGIIGAMLVSMVFDWALIVLSSLAGAVLIGQTLHLQHAPVLVIGLALLGIIVQAMLMRRKESSTE